MPAGPLVALAVTLLLAGVVAYGALAIFGARSRRARVGGALVLLLVIAGVVGVADTAAPTPAEAASAVSADDCPGDRGGGGGGNGGAAENSLTIIQTSVNTGIAPGVAPTIIAGRITNHGTASAPVALVTVSIEAVTKAPGAVAGSCDASDYVVQSAAMPVGRTLAPEESADFSGASIAFSEKGTNQDACKGATLRLGYRSS